LREPGGKSLAAPTTTRIIGLEFSSESDLPPDNELLYTLKMPNHRRRFAPYG
jgi:hypothetical protein